MRYWAVIGIGGLHIKRKTFIDLLTKAMADSSATVRVAAAGALCRLDEEKTALPVLSKDLKSQEEWVRLQAALELDTIGDKAMPAVEPLREALKDKHNKYVVRVANHTLNILFGTDNKVR